MAVVGRSGTSSADAVRRAVADMARRYPEIREVRVLAAWLATATSDEGAEGVVHRVRLLVAVDDRPG